MRTRNANHNDYGMNTSEYRMLTSMCKRKDDYTVKTLRAAVQECNEVIADELFTNLHEGVSFERLDGMKGLCYYSKQDFYGYRRKALFLFKEKIMEKENEIIEEWKRQACMRRYVTRNEAAKELNLSLYSLDLVAKKAGATVKLGALLRINMIALYDYIDRECAVS